jgi:integrase
MAKKAKMKDGIKQRYDGSWSVVVELAPVVDPETGKTKRRQKWITVRGSREDAVKKRNELRSAVDGHTYVDTSKMTLREWLPRWLELAKTDKTREEPLRASTGRRYQNVLDVRLLSSDFASIALQKITAADIKDYYRKQTVSSATLSVDHAILCSAFREAKINRLIAFNPMDDLKNRPRANRKTKCEEAKEHAWSPEEVGRFVAVAKKAGAQAAAFYVTALDTGMRLRELAGLRWANVDLDAGQITVKEQLLDEPREKGAKAKPAWGPTKSGRERVIDIDAGTVALLREHRRTQAELKMKNRLVFAKQWTEINQRGQMLGHPLQVNNLGQREYARLIKEAKVKRIKFHGLRHTMATTLLNAGEPVHNVSKRLGHASVAMTLEIYAHCLPESGKQMASKMGAVLHG